MVTTYGSLLVESIVFSIDWLMAMVHLAVTVAVLVVSVLLAYFQLLKFQRENNQLFSE